MDAGRRAPVGSRRWSRTIGAFTSLTLLALTMFAAGCFAPLRPLESDDELAVLDEVLQGDSRTAAVGGADGAARARAASSDGSKPSRRGPFDSSSSAASNMARADSSPEAVRDGGSASVGLAGRSVPGGSSALGRTGATTSSMAPRGAAETQPAGYFQQADDMPPTAASDSGPLGEVHGDAEPGPAVADWPGPTGPMTVEELFAFAAAHHPLLRARAHEISAAQGELVTAGLFPNPELVLDTDSPIEEDNSANMRLRVMFTIPTAGKRAKREAVAGAAIARARAALSRETETVLLLVAESANKVLYLQELAELESQLGALADQRAEIERSRFSAGSSTLANKTEAEVDAAQLRLRRHDTLARLAAARIRLSRAIGMNPPVELSVAGRLRYVPVDDVPLEFVLARARQVRPELAEAAAAVVESRRAHQLAKAEAFPDVSFGPRYGDTLADGNDEMGARLDFAIPVFDRNQGEIHRSAAETWVSSALFDDAEIRCLADVAEAHAELTALKASLDYYESEVLPLAAQTEKTLAEEEPSRAVAAVQISDMLRALIQMRLQHLELRYRYNCVRTRLGVLLGEWNGPGASAVSAPENSAFGGTATAGSAPDGVMGSGAPATAAPPTLPRRLPRTDRPGDDLDTIHPFDSMERLDPIEPPAPDDRSRWPLPSEPSGHSAPAEPEPAPGGEPATRPAAPSESWSPIRRPAASRAARPNSRPESAGDRTEAGHVEPTSHVGVVGGRAEKTENRSATLRGETPAAMASPSGLLMPSAPTGLPDPFSEP